MTCQSTTRVRFIAASVNSGRCDGCRAFTLTHGSPIVAVPACSLDYRIRSDCLREYLPWIIGRFCGRNTSEQHTGIVSFFCSDFVHLEAARFCRKRPGSIWPVITGDPSRLASVCFPCACVDALRWAVAAFWVAATCVAGRKANTVDQNRFTACV